jgi:hypothetical protein
MAPHQRACPECGCCHKGCCGGGGGGNPAGGGGGRGGGGGPGGGGLPPGWEPRPQGTWLLIRYEAADVGARPVPNGEVFWESPDIRVIGGDAFGNPTGGKPVALEARVWNQGDLDAAPVRVDFSFIAPSLGVTGDAPELIGTAWTTLLAGHSKIVACPKEWTPPEYVTDVHACVIVTCSAPAQRDTPSAPFNPALDRHVGQRNLTVLEGAAGQTFSLHLIAANPLAHRAQVAVVAAAAWLPQERIPRGPLLVPSLGSLGTIRAAAAAHDTGASDLWLKRATLRDIAVHSGPQPQPIGEISEIAHVESMRINEPTRATTGILPPPALVPHVEFASLRREVNLEPGQTATAELKVAVPRDTQGYWLAVHLAQSQNGQLTGGYTMLVRTSM